MCRFALAFLLFTSVFAAGAASVTPVVNSSTINYSLNPNQITITGTSFSPTGVAPTVLFNNINVAPLVSSSNSQIVAKLPTGTGAGTYRLRVTNSQGNFYEVDVTYGAVGPQGPIGPQGLTGATGAQGPSGSTGATGAQGPAGSTGPQGPPVSFKGNWANGVTYAIGDATFFSGSSYISVVSSNVGNQPDASPAQWAVLAQQGATGSQGPQGLTGAIGPQGPAGPTGPIGPQGPVGATGPQGPAGSSLFSLTGTAAVYTQGNVGIGTTTPGENLEVANNAKINGLVYSTSFNALPAATNGNDVSIQAGQAGGSYGSGLNIYPPAAGFNGGNLNLAAGGSGHFGQGGNITLSAGDAFDTNSKGGSILFTAGRYGGPNSTPGHIAFFCCADYLNSPSEVMRIDGNGNVGIHTTTPAAALDVNGNVAINGNPIIDASGNWVGNPTGLQGPTGPMGLTGPAGPSGPQGPEGPTGPQGPAGPAGTTSVPPRLFFIATSKSDYKPDFALPTQQGPHFPSPFSDSFSPAVITDTYSSWGFNFPQEGNSNMTLAVVQLPALTSPRTFEVCFNMVYGAYPTTNFALSGRISIVDPNNGYSEIRAISGDDTSIVPATSSFASDYPHSQKEWNYNNCGFFQSPAGGEYVTLLLYATFTSVTSEIYGTPGAMSIIPRYIKITTLD